MLFTTAMPKVITRINFPSSLGKALTAFLGKGKVSWSRSFEKFSFSHLTNAVDQPHHWCVSNNIDLVTSDKTDVHCVHPII